MNVWADILDDVAHNRSLADVLGVPHDPEWDAWESAAEAALRHAKHNQKDHGKGGRDAGFIELFASPAFGKGTRGFKKKELKKLLKQEAKELARNTPLGFRMTKKQAKAFAGIEWRREESHGLHRPGVHPSQGLGGNDRGGLRRDGRIHARAARVRSAAAQQRWDGNMNRFDGTQYRSFDLTTAEFRDDDAGDGFTFVGVASVVGAPYPVRDKYGEFTETIAEGAFDKTLAEVENRAKKAKTPGGEHDVALFINHRASDVPMASTYAGTLRLAADPHLRATANLDPVRSDVVIARSAVQRKELREMSIGFRVPKGRDDWNEDFTERMIHEVALDEVSIVRRGANPHTSASMRSLLDMLEENDELDEDELRQVLRRRGFVLEPAARPLVEAAMPGGLMVTPEMVELFSKRN